MSGFHGWISSYNDGTESRILTSGNETIISKPEINKMVAAGPKGSCVCPIRSHQIYSIVPPQTHPIQFRNTYIGGVNNCPPPPINYRC